MPIHPTGAWLDDDTGEVVYEPPRSGTQLVAKGGEVSSSAKRLIEARGLTVNGVNAGTGTADEAPAEDAPADDDKTITTGSASRRKSTK